MVEKDCMVSREREVLNQRRYDLLDILSLDSEGLSLTDIRNSMRNRLGVDTRENLLHYHLSILVREGFAAANIKRKRGLWLGSSTEVTFYGITPQGLVALKNLKHIYLRGETR